MWRAHAKRRIKTSRRNALTSRAGQRIDRPPDVGFRGACSPNRIWEAADVDGVDDILQQWFEPSDDLEEIVSIDTDSSADRARVAYRFRGRNPDGRFMVEQQAYYAEQDGQIAWMRIMAPDSAPPGTLPRSDRATTATRSRLAQS